VAVAPGKQSAMTHPVVITFLILAVIGAMSLAAEVLKPLALSVLLTFALTPLSRQLEKRLHFPRAAAVVVTVLLALGAIGSFGYVVVTQLETLANQLPQYKQNIQNKLNILKPNQESAMRKTGKMFGDMAREFDAAPGARKVADDMSKKGLKPGEAPPEGETPAADAGEDAAPKASIPEVRVVSAPSYRERLQGAVGPYIEFLGVGSFVLILVLFMMMGREDLRDRIVSLFGQSRVSLTTRTMDEIGHRISRYLATFAMVNSGFGLVVGLGLWAIHVPYAVLWGCMAAAMRFIPYVGPAVAFVLPLIFSVAFFEGWREPLLVVGLFAVIEVALNSFLEPVIYGKTTGVSALGLLVAAMFWTWLWGILGILLSTPLTVCLAVLGKYVPSLGVFATMLGEEADLEPDVRFYQRLVALDRDGAVEVIEEALKSRPRVEVFDAVLIPALSHAERDAAAGHLEVRDMAFVWRVVDEVLDDLEGESEITLGSVAAAAGVAAGEAPSLLGLSANDTGDAVVLRMLNLVLKPSGLRMELETDAATPARAAELVASRSPALVVLSHLPPQGLTSARYQVRKLRSRYADLPIMVGRWGTSAEASAAAKGLEGAGASSVALSLADARDQILSRFGLAPVAAGALLNAGG